MNKAQTGTTLTEHSGRSFPGEEARQALLAELPVEELQMQLAGIPTSILVGGDGPPLVLLHGPQESAAKWLRLIPDLTATYRLSAPDLPGHGASQAGDDPLTAERVLAWLGALIERTCASPPALVGLTLGGAIAARFACTESDKLAALVLVDAFGLAPFQPAPDFAAAMNDYLMQPSAATHDDLWRYRAFDLDRLRQGMGESWAPFAAYNLQLARAPGVQAAFHALFEHFGMSAIPPEDLARITVPTTLIWGRHDLATRLAVAEAAAVRHGWALEVIDKAGDDPANEQPDAFLGALRAALSGTSRAKGRKT